jgi:hypothetical protein
MSVGKETKEDSFSIDDESARQRMQDIYMKNKPRYGNDAWKHMHELNKFSGVSSVAFHSDRVAEEKVSPPAGQVRK